MSFLYAARNYAAGGKPYLSTPVGPVVSSYPDADYPASNAIDGYTSPPTRWAGLAGSYYLDASVNVIRCGDMEESGFPGWTLTSPTSTDVGYKGALAVSLGTGALGRQSVLVTAGGSWRFQGAVFDPGEISVRDLERGGGYYLDSGGLWTTTPSATITGSNGSWTQAARTFDTETLRAGWNRPDGLLSVELLGGDGGGESDPFLYDELLLYPAVDVFALVGHSFPPVATLSIVYDATDYWHVTPATVLGSSSTALKFPVGWYVHGSPAYAPFWRVQVDYPASGSAPRLPVVGELFIGKTVALPNPSYGPKIEWMDDQVRLKSQGKTLSYRTTSHPRRKVTLSFPCSTDAQWETLRDSLMLTSNMGSTPGLLIPTEMELDQALYGTVTDVLMVTRGPRSHRVVDVTFEEQMFPIMPSTGRSVE